MGDETPAKRSKIDDNRPIVFKYTLNMVLNDLFNPNQTEDERDKSLTTLEEKLRTIVKESDYVDTVNMLRLMILHNLTNSENKKKLDELLNEKWRNINKFVLLYVSIRNKDEEIKHRLRREFEEQISALKPVGTSDKHIIDRSWLKEALEEIKDFPIICRKFIVDVFLTVKVNDSGATPEEAAAKKQFPPIFKRLTALFDSKPTEGDIDVFMEKTALPETETKMLRILFKCCPLYKQCPPELENLLKTENMEVNELFLLFIAKKFEYSLRAMMSTEGQLREYFKRHFALNVPASSSGIFINRAYLVGNRTTIEQLPESCQMFLLSVLHSTNTTRTSNDIPKNTSMTPEKFILNQKPILPINVIE